MQGKWISALKWAWWLAILLFAGFFVHKNLDKTAQVLHQIHISTVFLSTSAILCAKLALSVIVYVSLRRYNAVISFRESFQIFNITQVAKYIPGSIWQYVGRAGLYKAAGLSNSQIRGSIIVETIWIVGSAFICGLFLILLTRNEVLAALLRALPFSTALLLLLIGGLAATGVILIYVFREALDAFIAGILIPFRIIVASLLTWLFFGFSLWIIFLPYINDVSVYLYIVGLYCLGFSIGFIVPFAPAGIGIREAVLVIGVTHIIPADTAVVLASLHRLFYIFTEFLLVVIAKVSSRLYD